MPTKIAALSDFNDAASATGAPDGRLRHSRRQPVEAL